jgi:uncharacterized membrane protein
MEGTVSGLRLVTVHPILVHVTLGMLPFVVVAYVVAAAARSERWTFAADAALVATALATLATLAFGLVSNGALEWPGGLGSWRWLHLGFGIGTTALLVGLAAWRLATRRRRPAPEARVPVAVALVAVVAAFTGWIGGEVLVYRAGMAVAAAADGAMAPPVTAPSKPRDVMSAMHLLRADWAAASADLASAVIERPTKARFTALAAAASSMQDTASWLATAPEGAGAHPALADGARELSRGAADLAGAAQRGDVTACASFLGHVTHECADCHVAHRWREEKRADGTEVGSR